MNAQRIPPVAPPYDAAVAGELNRWMPPGAAAEPLRLFRTLARHLTLAEAMRPLGSYLLSRRLSVGKREREIVIERVCARCSCEYEWGVHAAAFGAAAGLGEEQLHASAVGDASDPAWTETDALLVRLVDGLHDTGQVSDELWGSLTQHWSHHQLLDLVALAGWYHLIAYVANGARVELEPWGARFPAARDAR